MPAFGQSSLWSPSTVPTTSDVTNDSASVTVGLQFYSDVAGSITGVRFYKGSGNTGTHVGELWTNNGSPLARVTFSGESASGWQQGNFSAPVSIAANTTYVISYTAPQGNYAEDDAYPWSTIKASPLHVSGSSPGVYAYGTGPVFPQGTWNRCNYWVDVAFTTSATQSLSGTISNGSGATVTLTGATNATTTADASGSYSFAGVVNGKETVTPSKAGFAFSPASQVVTVNGAKVTGVNFSATPADSIWTSSVTPGTGDVANDTAPVTLGLKFYSDVPGNVTGVRFYKGLTNTGTHVGSLWTANGTNLASVSFSGETASGWQQASFSSPVNIAANTTYVISYLAPQGSYADDQSYSWSTVNASPLHVSGSSPGVFSYGASTAFPSGTWNASNYWVDLTFIPASGSASSPGPFSISGTVNGSAATLTLSGTSSASTATGAGASYSFSGLANGSYVVAPSQQGYSFSPSTSPVTVNGASITGVNFTATAVQGPVQHSVSLSWIASSSPNITGYKVYRGTVSGGPYTLIAGLMAGTAYVDGTVNSGQTYHYVTTSVDTSGNESGYSNEAVAAVPTP